MSNLFHLSSKYWPTFPEIDRTLTPPFCLFGVVLSIMEMAPVKKEELDYFFFTGYLNQNIIKSMISAAGIYCISQFHKSSISKLSFFRV